MSGPLRGAERHSIADPELVFLPARGRMATRGRHLRWTVLGCFFASLASCEGKHRLYSLDRFRPGDASVVLAPERAARTDAASGDTSIPENTVPSEPTQDRDPTLAGS